MEVEKMRSVETDSVPGPAFHSSIFPARRHEPGIDTHMKDALGAVPLGRSCRAADPEILPHDLLRVRGAADLCIADRLPDWVTAYLARTCWVVVRRSAPLEGMLPVGLRGNSRGERFAAYLPAEAILERITPEDLVRRASWRFYGRRELPALRSLDVVGQMMADFALQWGPTGSVGFEVATGAPTAKTSSDLDLVIRAPSELKIDVCRRLRIRLAERVAVRTDVLIETGAGAIALDEYACGSLPILLRSSIGPKLVYNPWETNDECCLHIPRTRIPGTGNASFSAESSSRHSDSGCSCIGSRKRRNGT